MTLIALLAAAATACGGRPEAAAVDPSPVAVALATVARTPVASAFEAGGVVRPRHTAFVASRVMATVAAVHARPGDRVRRGTPLVTLDAREAAARTSTAAAALTAAVESARANEADTRAAEAQVRLASATRARVQTLFDKRSATAHELDQAVAAVTAADAQLAGAQSRAAAAAAARDAARATLETASITGTYSVLTAPFDGIVSERQVDPGSLATPGTPLLTLEDATAYRLEVEVDEARAARLTLGDAVELRVDSLPDANWRAGRIAEIARIDPASHAFLVKLDAASPSGWRSGLYGRARFAGPARQTLTVPVAALVRRGQLTFVFAIDRDQRARLKAIRTGTTSGDRAEVAAGLAEGDRIVLDPPAGFADGTRVAP